MQHKANFLNNSLFSLLLLGLLGITSCNTVTRLNVKKDDGNALAPQHRGVSIDFEKKEEPNDPYAELRSAVINSRIDEVKRLIHKGVKAKHGPTGSTLLHDLANTSNVDPWYEELGKSKILASRVKIVNILVEEGVYINEKDKSGWTPLHTAVANKNGALVKALISSGADVTIKDSLNKTAYEIAEENKDEAVMNLFHESLKGTKWERELHSAIWKVAPCLKEIERLIALGVCVDAKDRSGNTPLHEASGNGHADVVKLLIKEGAKVGVRNKKGEAPLSWIARSFRRDIEKFKEIIEALINAGAEIDAQDNRGNTALHRVSERGHADVVKLLINAGADINAKNKDGDTALHRARENNHANVVELLIKEGAEVDASNNQNETLLAWAVDKGHTKVVNMLLDKDKDSSQGGPESSLSILVQTISNRMDIQDEEKRNRETSQCYMTFLKEPY